MKHATISGIYANQVSSEIEKRQAIILLLIGALLLIGIATYVLIASESIDRKIEETHKGHIKSGYDAYANIPPSEINYGGGFVEHMWDSNDPYYGFNTLPIAAIVYIDTIDGGRNYSPIFNQYTITQTYGKMTVLDVYKGDIKPGQRLNYARGGGIITAKEYWAQQKDKGIYLKGDEESTGKKYFKYTVIDDIDIEVDKKYLVFMSPQFDNNGEHPEYSIAGLQYGLREVKGSGTEITVLNNNTNQWEDLGKVVKLK